MINHQLRRRISIANAVRFDALTKTLRSPRPGFNSASTGAAFAPATRWKDLASIEACAHRSGEPLLLWAFHFLAAFLPGLEENGAIQVLQKSLLRKAEENLLSILTDRVANAYSSWHQSVIKMNNQTAYLFPAIGEQGKMRSSPIKSRPRMSMPAVIIFCLALLQLSAGSLYATKPPDVQVDTKTAPDAPLTLRQIYAKGKANYTTAAADAASNLASNQALLATLRDEANSSTHPGNKLGALMIERIAAIESRCDIVYAYSKPDYKGYFQMGADACQDVGADFAVISKPENWKIGCDAGVKFLNLNWKRVAGADTDFVADGSDVPSLTALYLAHQQGATGAAALWSHLGNGSAKSTAANDNMRANVGPKTLTAIDGTGDHEMSELEFYAYWVGAIDAVSAQITTP